MQRMPDRLGATSAAGMRSNTSSLSVENLGHSAEVEQHAPQAWHGDWATGSDEGGKT